MGRNTELGALTDGADLERQHVATIRMKGAAWIVAGGKQCAAEVQHRGVAARGGAFSLAAVGADERGVDGRLSGFFARAVRLIRITPRFGFRWQARPTLCARPALRIAAFGDCAPHCADPLAPSIVLRPRSAIRAFCHSLISASTQPTERPPSGTGFGNSPAAMRS
jgi:hypothetical protein